MADRTTANLVNDRTSQRNHGEIPHILVFTDIGKDIDDLMALLVLAQLHKEKRAKIVGVITSINPARKRAQLLRRILDRMDLGPDEIPVAYGTDATDDKNKHREEKYEFDYCQDLLNPEVQVWNDVNKSDHIVFAAQILHDAAKKGKKIRVLILTSFHDVNAVAQANRAVFDKVVSEVHMQGGLTQDEHGEYIPDPKDAQNMRFNRESSTAFWEILRENNGTLSWAVYTKYAATKCDVYIDDFTTQSAQMGIVGAYMQAVSTAQNFEFFRRSLVDQYTPNVQNVEWFVDIRTTLDGIHQLPAVDASLPKEETVGRLWDFVAPYAKLVPYDAVAALGCVSDVVESGGLGFGMQDFALDGGGTKFLIGGKEFRNGNDGWRSIFSNDRVSLAIRTYLCKALGSRVRGR